MLIGGVSALLLQMLHPLAQPWAKQQLSVAILPPWRQALLQQAVGMAARPLRWAVGQGSAQLARERMQG
jgi:hypothetical protein